MSDAPAWRITLSDLVMDAAEEQAVLDVLRSGWLSMGQRVLDFERAFARVHGAAHAVAVSSGTAALHLALLALDLGPGDEVIQPAINFVAAANMTRAVGAEPRFADILSPARPVLDPAAVRRLITPHTRAILALHYGGYPAPIESLAALAAEHGVVLLEDACHAPATPCAGQALGTWGLAGCFSFFPNKNLTTAEGGMLVTPDEDFARRCRTLRSHGMTTMTWQRHQGHASSYDVTTPGFNYRMDELRAALGVVQLGRLAQLNERRLQLTQVYRQRLADVDQIEVVFGTHDGPCAAHLLVVLVPPEARAHVLHDLRQRGIQTSLHYPCITRFSGYRSADEVPKSAAFSACALTLPLHPRMTDADVGVVCAAVEQALRDCRIHA